MAPEMLNIFEQLDTVIHKESQGGQRSAKWQTLFIWPDENVQKSTR